jgi:hypothetical protein
VIPPAFAFTAHHGVFATHNTRTHVRLLGPCFKTGRLKPFAPTPGPPRVVRHPTQHWPAVAPPSGRPPRESTSATGPDRPGARAPKKGAPISSAFPACVHGTGAITVEQGASTPQDPPSPAPFSSRIKKSCRWPPPGKVHRREESAPPHQLIHRADHWLSSVSLLTISRTV